MSDIINSKDEDKIVKALEELEKLTLDKPKVSKKNLTAFWGISVDKDIILQNEQVKKCLSENPELIVLTKPVHTTLLYVGKKPDNPDELKFIPLEKKKCTVIVNGFGYSKDALALRVTKMTYNDEELKEYEKDVPTNATIQHITLALKEGILAKDSVKTLTESSGIIVTFDIPLILVGEIKRYLF